MKTTSAQQARRLAAREMSGIVVTPSLNEQRVWRCTLPAIPDWHAYSGNTRYAHPMMEHKAVKRIRGSWGQLLDTVELPSETFDRYTLRYVFRCPDLKKVPRDWDNVMRATKPLTDALGEYGIIVNDSRAHMVRPPDLWIEKGGPETVIEIRAV